MNFRSLRPLVVSRPCGVSFSLSQLPLEVRCFPFNTHDPSIFSPTEQPFPTKGAYTTMYCIIYPRVEFESYYQKSLGQESELPKIRGMLHSYSGRAACRFSLREKLFVFMNLTSGKDTGASFPAPQGDFSKKKVRVAPQKYPQSKAYMFLQRLSMWLGSHGYGCSVGNGRTRANAREHCGQGWSPLPAALRVL
jgi:hypothetical protein